MIKGLRPILEITKARLREFYREPGALFWVFGFPVIMAVVLGLAFSARPPSKPRLAIVENTHSEWLEKALQSGGVDWRTLSLSDAEDALRKNAVDLIARADARGQVTYLYDSSHDESRLARMAVDDALQRGEGRKDVVSTSDGVLKKQGTRYIDFLIPGLMGLNIMGGSMWGVGYSLVMARRRRLLRRLAATPMRRSHFLLGYILFRLIFLLWELTALMLFGFLVFDVTVQGSLVSVAVIALIGAMAFTGMSLMVAARTESLEAANGWLNFLMLPSWLLSGAFFSYLRFPEVMHTPIRALPLTALNDALRGVFNDGATLLSFLPELGVLSLWASISFVVALKTFRWQ